MSVRMRHTKGHTRNRRAHHGLKSPRVSSCGECNSLHIRHRMCDSCGKYRNKTVVDVVSVLAKKNARLVRKQKSMGIETEKDTSKKDE